MLDAGQAEWTPEAEFYTSQPAPNPLVALTSTERRREIVLFAKRILDIVLSVLALLFLSPMLLIVGVAVKVSSRGPVLFWQERVGEGGKLFWLCKFRTFHAHHCDTSGVQHTVAGDGRVTSLGRVLRRHSVDELPQLLNVLRGDMSLVGPRAHVSGMLVCGIRYETAVDNYPLRHQVRPGLTGLAQVRGLRGPVLDLDHASGRVEADLEYIQTLSLALDLKIMLKTLLIEIFKGSGV